MTRTCWIIFLIFVSLFAGALSFAQTLDGLKKTLHLKKDDEALCTLRTEGRVFGKMYVKDNVTHFSYYDLATDTWPDTVVRFDPKTNVSTKVPGAQCGPKAWSSCDTMGLTNDRGTFCHGPVNPKTKLWTDSMSILDSERYSLDELWKRCPECKSLCADLNLAKSGNKRLNPTIACVGACDVIGAWLITQPQILEKARCLDKAEHKRKLDEEEDARKNGQSCAYYDIDVSAGELPEGLQKDIAFAWAEGKPTPRLFLCGKEAEKYKSDHPNTGSYETPSGNGESRAQ